MTDTQPVVIHANGAASEDAGVRQVQKGFKPPQQPVPGMLTQEMAEVAAQKYNKKQKKIQKACAKLDSPEEKTGCGCILM